MKKLFALLLSLVMVSSMAAGCGAKKDEGAQADAEITKQTEDGSGQTAPADGTAEDKPAEGAATDGQTAAGGEVKIAFLVLEANDWTQKYLEDAKAACQEYGYEYLEFNCKGDPQTQVDQIQTCISQGVTGIQIQASQNASVAPALKKAADQGIIITSLFNMEPELQMDDVLYYVVYGQYDAGRLVGEEILKHADSGKAGIIGGTPGADNSMQRKQGFKDAVDGKLEIVAEIDASWDRAKAQTAAEDMITANPDLKVIFPIDDGMAVGVLEAVKAAGKEGEILIGSINGDPVGVEMVEGDEIVCTVAVGTKWYADKACEVVKQVLNGETVERTQVYVPEVITKDNVADYK
ncbi:sugar ABC transporter substrate-binding protein [Diplocloster agilis]|uniref:sugar ABC transporter substrate-binding protein n=1 Tax=Diplocloster agilis TaxID=2850323 RepID=UPI0008203A47|nr:sugar ABC transporter substrate-binding protein [Suonthocola fibrivorans]MCU6733293.1 sugar ABC transporter substrate-binding protein [Suonthocola fibrivorans]SCI86070.1 D-ribose-binding periplasmic protein precursor [uncultured Clostridium sp.]